MADGEDRNLPSPTRPNGDSNTVDVEKAITAEKPPIEQHPGGLLGDAGKEVVNRENIVWWEEPADQDPSNPMAWPQRRKWGIIATMSFMTFLTYVLLDQSIDSILTSPVLSHHQCWRQLFPSS